MSQILQHLIQVDGNHKPVRATLGELVHIVARPEIDGEFKVNIDTRVAKRHLGRYGIRVMPEVIWISNRAPALSALLSKTAWPSNWNRVLRRLSGAEAANGGEDVLVLGWAHGESHGHSEGVCDGRERGGRAVLSRSTPATPT